MSRFCTYFVLSGVACIVLSACNLPPWGRFVPSYVLLDTTCRPPCWHGIDPGQSTLQDAREQLRRIPEIDTSTITEIHLGIVLYDHIGWGFRDWVGDVGGFIYLKGDRVATICFDTRESLSVAQVVSKLGEPEQVSVGIGPPDNPDVYYAFLYPSKGFAMTKFDPPYEPSPGPPKISPDDRVNSLAYFYPPWYQEVLRAGTLGVVEYTHIEPTLHPWRGFGVISQLYPESFPETARPKP